MPGVGSEKDYKAKQAMGDFKPMAEGEYVFTVLGFSEKEGTYHAQYNPDTIPDIIVSLKPVEDAEDEELPLLDNEGKPLHPDKYINMFIKGTLAKPRSLGFGPAGASKARRLIWAAAGVSVKESLNFEWEDLIGKKVIASITLNDAGYERIETVRPLKKNKPDRAEERIRPKPVMVEAAEEVFKDDVADDY